MLYPPHYAHPWNVKVIQSHPKHLPGLKLFAAENPDTYPATRHWQ